MIFILDILNIAQFVLFSLQNYLLAFERGTCTIMPLSVHHMKMVSIFEFIAIITGSVYHTEKCIITN